MFHGGGVAHVGVVEAHSGRVAAGDVPHPTQTLLVGVDQVVDHGDWGGKVGGRGRENVGGWVRERAEGGLR